MTLGPMLAHCGGLGDASLGCGCLLTTRRHVSVARAQMAPASDPAVMRTLLLDLPTTFTGPTIAATLRDGAPIFGQVVTLRYDAGTDRRTSVVYAPIKYRPANSSRLSPVVVTGVAGISYSWELVRCRRCPQPRHPITIVALAVESARSRALLSSLSLDGRAPSWAALSPSR